MSERLAFGVEPSTRRYRLRLARYKGVAEAVAAFVRARPAGSAPVRLLDIGSGNGRTLRYLEAEGVADQVEFYALEYSTRRIDGMFGRSRWRIVQADAQEAHGLPFADETFDVVICEQVLEHLHYPERVVREAGRLMSPGGLLVAGVPSFPPGMAAIRKHVVPAFDRLLGRKGDHVQAFSCESFKRLIQQSGPFELIDARGFRVLSGGLLAPLEDQRWFWRMNRTLGSALPWLCIEIQVLARRIVSPAGPVQTRR